MQAADAGNANAMAFLGKVSISNYFDISVFRSVINFFNSFF